jgi:hypothetical protein
VSETFPFATDAAETSAEADGNRTKVLAVLAGLVALVLLAFFVVLPMLSGDDDAGTPTSRPKVRSVTTKPAAKPAAKAPAKTVAPTFKDSFERDPFKPLYVAPVANAAPNPATGGVAPAPATGGAAPAPGVAPAGTSAQVGSSRVALVDVFTRDGKTYAQTKVNDTVHTPAVGGDFAGSYRLLGATGTCATYLFGDEQFRLCEGQEVLK